MIINGYKLLDDFGFYIEEFLHQLILVRAEKLGWILISRRETTILSPPVCVVTLLGGLSSQNSLWLICGISGL